MIDAATPNPHLDKRLTYEQNLYQNILFFAHELWIDRELHRLSPLSEVEEDIIDYAAFGIHDNEYRKKRGVLAPRKLGKTTFVVALLTCWRLYRDPKRQILIVSKSHDHAKKIVRLIKGWVVNVPFLSHLAPQKTLGNKDSTTAFDVAGAAAAEKQASVTAIGIEGQLEGNRAHSVFPDDVETKGNTKSLEARDQLNDVVREFANILYDELPLVNGKPNPDIIPSVDPCEICYVGTFHHEDSLYIRLNGRGYRFQTWPIAYPAPQEQVINLAPMLAQRLRDNPALAGTPVYPHRFDARKIEEKRMEGYLDYALQQMLLCDMADKRRYPLRLRDLIVMSIDRDRAPVGVVPGETTVGSASTAIEGITIDAIDQRDRLYGPAFIDKMYAPFQGTKAYIDPAGRGTDRTGFAVVSLLHGMLWTKTVRGFKGGSDEEALAMLARECRRYGARDIYYEGNFDPSGAYGRLLEAAIQQHYLKPGEAADGIIYPDGWSASLTRRFSSGSHGHKELRIIGILEPVISSRRMVIDPECLRPRSDEEQHESLQYQITRITKDRKCLTEDGKIDAWAGCVAEFTESLAVTPQIVAARAIDKAREKAIEEAAGRIRNSPLYKKPQAPCWFRHRHFAR